MKFRVYDNTEQRYKKGFTIDEDGDLIKVNHGAVSLKRYTVELCTGFTDKNGREIYEGDRVERKHEFGVVQFINGQWVIMRGGILLGSVAYQAADFEVTGTVHDANCSEKANSSNDETTIAEDFFNQSEEGFEMSHGMRFDSDTYGLGL